MERVIVSWSGGKDSAYALRKIEEKERPHAEELLTTISTYNRSSIHGIRKELIGRQAEELGISLKQVTLPEDCSDQDYEEIMSQVMDGYKERGIKSFVFADVSLEEVRDYREKNLSSAGFKGYWPLWGKDTSEVVRNFLREGFEATVVAVDGNKLDKSLAGRELDQEFLDELPSDVDDCGENGEYHTFVRNGPIFSNPIKVKKGELVERKAEGNLFYYRDLLPQ